MESDLQRIIGSQLIGETSSGLLFKKDDKVFELEIDTYNGDCCGYAEFNKTLFISDSEPYRNPVITKVDYSNSATDYRDPRDSDWDIGCETCEVTLFGENAEIAKISAIAGSGSGWKYGACVSVECPILGIREIIAGW